MSKRDALVQAAKKILWEEGFEAMSPKKVMRAAGAGQGSLYHHFDGKEALATAALEQVTDEMCAWLEVVFDKRKPPMQRLEDYLLHDRDELKGCKLGRLVQEKSCDEALFRVHIERYFPTLHTALETALLDALAGGNLPPHLEASELAHTLMAIIQGGYVLARASANASHMTEAQVGAWSMLESLASQ